MQHRLKHLSYALAFCCLLLSTVATAALQPLPEIRAAAAAAIRASLGDAKRTIDIEVDRLDPRLRLARCSVPLAATPNAQAQTPGRVSVNVRCEGDASWSLFVQVLVREQRQVAVATAGLPAGHSLVASDATLEPRWLTAPNASYIEDPAQLIGRLTTRPFAAGALLVMQGLKTPRAIRRGAHITVALASGAVAIRTNGIALQDGAIGDRIQVRNDTSRRIVEGVIAEDGSVVVR